jgi:hypothetical protein
MVKKDYDEITIIYKIDKNDLIKIFDSHFVNNNKNNCKIIFEDKKYELQKYFNVKNYNKKKEKEKKKYIYLDIFLLIIIKIIVK